MKDLIIIDNSPTSYMFQPENGMPILSWYDDRADNKLIELIPVLKALSEVPDVRTVLSQSVTKDNVYVNEKSLKICE
jgi:RNA polymerase II subunit A small phosphatase-like protein